MLKAINIEWDVDEECFEYDCTDDDIKELFDSLPKEIDIPDGMEDEEEISDYISNLTGFCHNGFSIVENK